MDRKKLVLLLGALIIAIGTALAARSMFAGAAAPAGRSRARRCRKGPRCWSPSAPCRSARSSPPTRSASSCGRRKWSRTPISSTARPTWPSCSAPSCAIRSPPASRSPRARWSRPGDRGFLAAALGPGMRAITVPVSAKTGVGGFVFPGDRVDLMLTQTVDGRRRRGAQGHRDDPAQPARARHRPVDRDAPRRRRQDRRPRIPHRHARSDAADRREDLGRADDRHAQPVAALDRRQPDRARARDRLAARSTCPTARRTEEEEKLLRQAMAPPAGRRLDAS